MPVNYSCENVDICIHEQKQSVNSRQENMSYEDENKILHRWIPCFHMLKSVYAIKLHISSGDVIMFPSHVISTWE